MQLETLKSLLAKCIFIFSLLNFSLNAQVLPVGFIEQYANPCNNENIFKTLIRKDSSLWKISSDASLKLDASISPEMHSSIGILDKMIFGEYIIEFDFRIDNNPGNSCCFSFLSNMKSKDSYYIYSFTSDSIQFFLKYKGFEKFIGAQPIKKLKPGWNKARIEWNILSRNTTIMLNNNQINKITFNDNKLVMGYLGFSNGNMASSIKNIKIWAPTCITDKSFVW
jgi:hypothetical protein